MCGLSFHLVGERIEFDGYNGVRIAAQSWKPKGEPHPAVALLLHGGGQTRFSWGGTAAALAARGFHAITLDGRGHGESSWAPDSDYRLSSFGYDVAAVIEALDSPVYLVGASLGGLTSILLMGDLHPGIAEALVLVDVVPEFAQAGSERIGDFMRERMHTGFANLDEAADAIAAYNPHRPRPTDLGGLSKNLRERDGRWYWHWDPQFVAQTGDNELTDRPRLMRAAKAIDKPMLLVRGKVSDLVTEEVAAAFLAEVPDCEYIDVSGAGHMVAGDRNDLFTNAVVDFLTRVRPPS